MSRNDIVWRILRSLDTVDTRRPVPLDKPMNVAALENALEAVKVARTAFNTDSYRNNLAYLGALVVRAMEDADNEQCS